MVYGVLEELPTGIWIVSPTGATVSINRYAHRICRLLLKSESRRGERSGSVSPSSHSLATIAEFSSTSVGQQPDTGLGEQSPLMPSAVQRLYHAVIESRDLFPDRPVIIEDLVQIGSLTVHLRARWLELELDSYILVMLESPQIHPLAKLSKLVHRDPIRRMSYKWRQTEPEQFLGQLGYLGY